MFLHQTLVFITLYSKVYHTIVEMFIALNTYVYSIIQEYFHIDHKYLSQRTIFYHTTTVVFIALCTHVCFFRQQCFHAEYLFCWPHYTIKFVRIRVLWQTRVLMLVTLYRILFAPINRVYHTTRYSLSVLKPCHTGLFSHCNTL